MEAGKNFLLNNIIKKGVFRMKKRFFSIAMIFGMTGSLVLQYPHMLVSADEYEKPEILYDFSEYENEETDIIHEYDVPGGIHEEPLIPDVPETIPLTSDDVTITPSSKKLHIGSKFEILVEPSDPDFWDEYDEQIWKMSYEDSISSVEYKSKKPYIAKVNKRGVVQGKHKGTTNIVTTVNFENGEILIIKTKVRVTE